MKRFSYCANCGEAVPVFETGLCKDCQLEVWDAGRTEPMKPPRPAHINSGLKVCEKCGTKAASVKGLCVNCYKKAQHAALTPEQRDARKARNNASHKRRRDEKRAAKFNTDSLM